jgi:hypothetical protein
MSRAFFWRPLYFAHSWQTTAAGRVYTPDDGREEFIFQMLAGKFILRMLAEMFIFRLLAEGFMFRMLAGMQECREVYC